MSSPVHSSGLDQFQSLDSQIGFTETLTAVCRAAVQLVDVDHSGLVLFDEDRQWGTVRAEFPSLAVPALGKRVEVKTIPLEERLVSLGEPMVIDDVEGAEKLGSVQTLLLQLGIKSIVVVPITVGREIRGSFSFDSTQHKRRFDQPYIEKCQSLAQFASLVVENAYLRLNEIYKAERLQELAAATNEIVGTLSTGNRKERLTLIADHAHRVLDAEAGGILLVQELGWLTLVASHGHREGGFEEGRKLQITSGDATGLTGHIAWEGKVFRECGENLKNHFAVKNKYADFSPSGECYSLIAVPLTTQTGDLRGLLRISNKKSKAGRSGESVCFTDGDEAIAKIFAQAAVVAIDTAELLDEVKKGERRYRTLLDACQGIAQARAAADGLEALAETLVELLDKSFCRVLLIDEAGQCLKVVAAAKQEGEFNWKPRLQEDTLVGDWKGLERSLNSGQPVILRWSELEERRTLLQMTEWLSLSTDQGLPARVLSLLAIPLKVGPKRVGLLNVGDLRQESGFTNADLEQGVAISAQVSALVERLERDKKFLFDLFKTERELNATKDIGQTLKLIAGQVFEVANWYGRHVNVVDINVREGDKIKVVAVWPEDRLDIIRKIVGEDFDLLTSDRIGIVGRVFLTGLPINEGDVFNNSDYIAIHDDTRSQLVVPIKSEDESTIGVISVENSEVGAFDSQDLIIVEGLASQAGSAILKDIQSRENKKVRTIALVGAAASIWKHTIEGAASLISSESDRALIQVSDPRKVSECIGRIKEKARWIQTFPFTGPLSEVEGVFPEALNPAIEEKLERLKSRLHHDGLLVEFRTDLTSSQEVKVLINKNWFQYALKMFLENARESVSNRTKKLIEIETRMKDLSHCRILVGNSGQQVPSEIWDKLGNEQIEKSDGKKDRGVGLLIADLILAVYGGKFEKIANEEDHIVLGITLPIIE